MDFLLVSHLQCTSLANIKLHCSYHTFGRILIIHISVKNHVLLRVNITLCIVYLQMLISATILWPSCYPLSLLFQYASFASIILHCSCHIYLEEFLIIHISVKGHVLLRVNITFLCCLSAMLISAVCDLPDIHRSSFSFLLAPKL